MVRNVVGGGAPADQADNEDLAQLLAKLRIAYRQAGEPAYRAIATLAGRRLSASTVSRIFNAKKPPKWRNLALMLSALGVSAHDQNTIWHPLWAQAVNRENPIDDPANTTREKLSPGTQDKSCARCGASVVDADVHAKWHVQLSRAVDLLEALERNSKRPMQLTTRPSLQPRSRGTARTPRTDSGPGAASPAPTGDGH
jgi:hypothetical protein